MIKLIILSILVSGCASTAELALLSNNSKKVAGYQAQAAIAQKDTLTIDCSLGCGKAKIRYLDQRDRQQVTGVKVNGTNDVIIQVAPEAFSLGKWVVGGVTTARTVGKIVEGAGSGTNTRNTIINNGDNNTLTPTNSVSATQSSADGNVHGDSADNNQANPTTSTISTATTTTTDNSNQNNPNNSNQNNPNNSNQGNPIDNNSNQNNPVTN